MKVIISENELKKFLSKKILEYDGSKYYLKVYEPAGQDKYSLHEIEIQKKSSIVNANSIFTDTSGYNKDNVETWIDNFRKLWSEKAGPTAGYRNLCVSRMNDFFDNYPSVTIEEIFEARDLYFQVLFAKHGNYKYLQHPENFINKYSNEQGMHISNLFRFIETIRSGVKDVNIINENLTYDDI